MPLTAILILFLPPGVHSAAEEALLPAGMTPERMNFERNWASSVAMPDSLVLAALDDVWSLPAIAREQFENHRDLLEPPVALGSFPELLAFLEEVDQAYRRISEDMGEGLVDSLTLILGSLWASGDSGPPCGEWGAAYSGRGVGSYPGEMELHPESLAALFSRWPGVEPVSVPRVLSLAVSSGEYWRGVPSMPSNLPGVQGDVKAWCLDGPVTWVVGGRGPNIYSKDCPFALIIDLGGDDTYGPGIGGVVGGAGKGFVSMVIDLGGNDTWESTGLPVSQGGALFGFACVVSMGGSNVYRGGSLSQGSGMMGQGILADLSGDDLYLAAVHSQGAGTLGTGLLLDRSGDDIRRVASFGQGFGGPGGTGVLVDGDGHDVYLAGFAFPHDPLLPRDHRAMSQGFGMGLRPFIAGGVGMLLDYGHGNDTYRAEVFGQGSSYWYALGILVDEGGQDLYSAAQYSQGTGIHLSAGVLADLSGDDQYISRHGPAQGSAHDLSTGFLFDGGGNDIYVTDGGQGLALTNSAAVFVDMGGNDVFGVRNLGQGEATWARGSSGSGLFLSMADQDAYLGRGEDSTAWHDGYSAGLDLSHLSPGEQIPMEPVGSPEALETDSLFRVASEWGVSGNRERVRAHLDELVSRGDEAVDFVLANHLDSWDGLEHRAITAVLKANRETAFPLLMNLLEHGAREGREFSNTVSWLGELGMNEAETTISGMLSDTLPPSRVVTLIRALGGVGTEGSVPLILPFAGSENDLVRRETGVTLGRIGSSSARPALERLAEDPKLDVASAAEEALRLLESEESDLTED